ncbi:hypothetical protein K469DRAFT_749090 [Zopfia rhizophila CBS 207.26]|uniref:F-box domain-containing protein n=1 Tax=Zopfia rhizophila CBS 207.26 TaxID=1314779 RepID=A0A6A6E5R5_9PEZI|nr:hypothetical protein K469DRAFT_749090 [Zopfia rhizophila CBS 207.26]
MFSSNTAPSIYSSRSRRDLIADFAAMVSQFSIKGIPRTKIIRKHPESEVNSMETEPNLPTLIIGRANLHTLPLELLLEITRYLSPSAVACLACVTRRLYADLDHSSFFKLKSKDIGEHTTLIYLLAKNQPHLTACWSCRSLHSSPSPNFNYTKYISDKIQQYVHLFSKSILKPSDNSLWKPQIQLYTPNISGPWKLKPELVFEISGIHIHFCLIRSTREHGALHNVGSCTSTLDSQGRKTLALTSEETESFTATLKWRTQARVLQGSFVHMTEWRIILSTPLLSRTFAKREPEPEARPERFHNLRAALKCIPLKCSDHCSEEAVMREVVCKLNQMLIGATNCVSAQKQPRYRCGEHVHWSSKFATDVEVLVVGARAVQIKIWRFFGQETGPKTRGGIGKTDVKGIFERAGSESGRR